jgi:hypothetical protein
MFWELDFWAEEFWADDFWIGESFPDPGGGSGGAALLMRRRRRNLARFHELPRERDLPPALFSPDRDASWQQ